MPPIGGMLVDEGKIVEEVAAGVDVVEDDVEDVDELDVLLVEVLLDDVDELLEVLLGGDEVVLLEELPGGAGVVLVAVVMVGGNSVVEPPGKMVVVAGA